MYASMAVMRSDGLQERLLHERSVSDSIAVNNRRICYVTVAAMCLICLTVIVIIALGAFLIIHRIVKAGLQKAELRANRISISNPTENGFRIAIDASLNVTDSFVVFTETAMVDLMYGYSTISEIVMDSSKISGSTNILLNSTALIQSQDAFAKLTRDLVTYPSVEINLRSTVDVMMVSSLLGNLTHCSVLMDKKLTLTGFGGMKPVINNFTILGGNESNFDFHATFDINNPTVFSLIPVGVLSFTLFSDSVEIGEAVSESSWSFNPGLNKDLSIIGTIAPSSDRQFEKISEIMQDLTNNKNVIMTAVSRPPYSSEPIYAKGLANITVDFEVAGAAINYSKI